MFGIAVLAAALMTMAAVGPCRADTTTLPEVRPCRYTLSGLPFNPWDAWNIYSEKNVRLFGGAQVQGKVAAVRIVVAVGGSTAPGAQVNTAPSAFATQPPFAVTSGSYALVMDSAVVNGGVDVQEGIISISSAIVHGDLRAGGTVASMLDNAVVSGVFNTTVQPQVSGDPPAGGVNIVTSVPKTVDFTTLGQYFIELSEHYNGLSQDVADLDLSTVETDGVIRVKLHRQVNVVHVTPEDIAAANKIILSGIPNAVLIINIATRGAVKLNKLDVVYEGARGRVTEPTFNRVLLNFPSGGNVLLGAGANLDWNSDGAHLHAQGKEQSTANHTEIEAQARAIHAAHAKRTHARVAKTDEKPVMHFSVLAPYSFFNADNVIVKGNVIGNIMGLTNAAEVHTRPWGRFAPKPPRHPPSKVSGKCLWGNI